MILTCKYREPPKGRLAPDRALAVLTRDCHNSVDAGDIVNVESVDSETAVPTSNGVPVVSSPRPRAARLPADWLVLRPSRRTE
jgi:hypothetical protein